MNAVNESKTLFLKLISDTLIQCAVNLDKTAHIENNKEYALLAYEVAELCTLFDNNKIHI